MAKTSRTRKTPKPNPADALTAINSDRVAQTTINSDRGRESVLLTRNTTHGYWRHIHWLYYNPTSLQKHYPLPETLGCCVLGILCIRDVATQHPNSGPIQWARGSLCRRTPATHRLNDACAWQGWAGTRQHKSGSGRAVRGERHRKMKYGG